MNHLKSFIPFVDSVLDADLVNRHFAGCAIARVPLRVADKVIPRLTPGMELWIDLALDGIGRRKSLDPTYADFLISHGAEPLLDDDLALDHPDAVILESLVHSACQAALGFNPRWITVPQLPFVDDGRRNRANRILADSTARWVSKSGFSGGLVLPALPTKPGQTKGKTQRKPKVKAVVDCATRARADAVWIADTSLNDQRCTENDGKKFEGLIAFHQELRNALPPSIHLIAGPYWGLNLVLWGRRLCDMVAVGVGGGFQYYVPGTRRTGAPKTRIVLPPLRRLAVAGRALRQWLRRAAEEKRRQGDVRSEELERILLAFDQLLLAEPAKWQVAEFYGAWIDRLGRSPEGGRALALYQDLSSAYVFGAGLGDLPDDQRGRSREPGRVAELLMLVALG
jgi:hypothetical protein